MDNRLEDRGNSDKATCAPYPSVAPASKPAGSGIAIPRTVVRGNAYAPDESHEQSGLEPAHVESAGARTCFARGVHLLDKLQIVGSRTERSALIQSIGKSNGPRVVSFLNAHAFNLAWSDAHFYRNLMESDVLLRDGVGVSLLLKLLGGNAGVNMNGTDMIPELLAAHDRNVALFGTCDPYLNNAAHRLAQSGVDVKVTVDGFQPDDTYLNALLEFEPSIVILAMGMPKQERIAGLLKQHANWPCVIVNGGAILDFLAGRVRRAPRIVRSLQLEWAFRLALEPIRLGKRYVIGNLAFLARSIRLRRWLRTQA
jgi:exopolysaccharide biosynthesis WecB/TagA/CpsF family protein